MTEKHFKLTAWFIVSVCLLGVGCTPSQPEQFPDTDIVYQAGDLAEPKIGFVNADGSNSVVLPTDKLIAKPFWSADGKTLYVLEWNGTGGTQGNIAFWPEGKSRHVCRHVTQSSIETIGGILVEPGSIQALVNTTLTELLWIDLKHCRVTRTYVNAWEDQDADIVGNSLSSDGTQIVYAETRNRRVPQPTYSIKILNLTDETTVEIGEGIYPSWSPDDQWIAYLQLDGIYIMASDGSQSRRLVQYNARSPLTPHDFGDALPAPRWSPDGQWLIYHRLVGTTRYESKSSIFKANVATGQEVKIVDGGFWPFWRERSSSTDP